MKYIILTLLVLLVGCGDSSLDKEFVRAGSGKVYQLEHRVGDCYILHEIDTAKIESLK